MKNIFPFLLVILSACGTVQDQEETNEPIPDSFRRISDTGDEYNADIFKFIFEITGTDINKYIHPQKGLWLIQSPGAMPEMTNTTQVDKNFPVDFSGCKTEELPSVNCDSKSSWTKDGCFLQEKNSFKDEKIWEYASLDESSKAAISESAQAVSLTVINTALNARYYFGLAEGKWYLLFADLRTPCSA